MNNHLKSILKVCGIVGLICLVTVLSCLPFVNFDNNKAELHADLRPCDTISNSFESSNININTSFFSSNQWAPGTSIDTFPICYDFNLSAGVFIYHWYNSTSYDYYTRTINFVGTSWYNNTEIYVGDFGLSYFFTAFRCDADFNYNVTSVYLGTSSGFMGDLNYTSQFVEFYDTNNRFARFTICVRGNYGANLVNRRYYLINPNDNDYYNSGYSDGYSLGRVDGYNNGYNIGYDVGYNNGEIVGYNNGLNDQDVYTFGNLLTAVIDAPVGVFISMLDFNIMGFNLLNLVVGLLTLAVICLVIKLMLGGK